MFALRTKLLKANLLQFLHHPHLLETVLIADLGYWYRKLNEFYEKIKNKLIMNKLNEHRLFYNSIYFSFPKTLESTTSFTPGLSSIYNTKNKRKIFYKSRQNFGI